MKSFNLFASKKILDSVVKHIATDAAMKVQHVYLSYENFEPSAYM